MVVDPDAVDVVPLVVVDVALVVAKELVVVKEVDERIEVLCEESSLIVVVLDVLVSDGELTVLVLELSIVSVSCVTEVVT